MQVTTKIPGQIDLIEEVIASFPEQGHIIDIGTGAGVAAKKFFDAGWVVTASGFDMEAYLGVGNSLPDGMRILNDLDICNMAVLEDSSMDAVWCAHVLEHVSNTGKALSELRRILKPGGWLFITVPPFKHDVVGGHVNAGWNIGTLMYVLADAGFDLSQGRFVRHGYNIFGMVQRGPGQLPQGELRRANGDIEKLVAANRFPKGFDAKQSFNGNLPGVNWTWKRAPQAIPVRRTLLEQFGDLPKIRIGFFVPWISKGKGGTENVGHMMANAMAIRDHEVVIFTFDDQRAASRWPLDPRIRLIHLPEQEGEVADQIMTVEVASCNLDLLVGLHMNRAMRRYVRCAQKLALPIVLSEHIDPRFPNWLGVFPEDERVITFSGSTLIHILVDAFSSTVPDFLKSRVRVIPNTIPEPRDLATPGIEKERKVLLSVSRLVPRKNTSRLIEAFSKLAPQFPDWTLRIVGDGPQEKALRAQVEELGIANAVEFMGHQENTYPFYRDADIFVIPSAFEGFPLTLCEALAHGVPSVGYAVCDGTKAQIIHGKNGLLAEGGTDLGTLADEIKKLMGNTNLRREMGQAARETFMSRFSNDIIHEAWEKMFIEAHEIGPIAAKPNQQQIAAVRLHDMVWGPAQLSYTNKKKA